MRQAHATNILEMFYFRESPPSSMSSTEVANNLGVSYSSARRNLLTLTAEGYLNRDGLKYFPIRLSDKIKYPKTKDEINSLKETDILMLEDRRLVHFSYVFDLKNIESNEQILLTLRGFPINEFKKRGPKALSVRRNNIIPLEDGRIRIKKVEREGVFWDIGPHHSDYFFYGIPLVEDVN